MEQIDAHAVVAEAAAVSGATPEGETKVAGRERRLKEKWGDFGGVVGRIETMKLLEGHEDG